MVVVEAEAEADARTHAQHEAEAKAEAEADSEDQFLIRCTSNTSCIFRKQLAPERASQKMTLRFCLGLAVALVAVYLLRRQTQGFVDDCFDFRFSFASR